MSENAEYNQLVTQKRSAEIKISQANSTKRALQSKIDRLEAAKAALGKCHNEFSDIKKAEKKNVEGRYEWQGRKYDGFESNGANLTGFNQMYYKNIDTARDAVNSEIARLENEIYRQNGLLGELRALVNSLAHKIENFFN